MNFENMMPSLPQSPLPKKTINFYEAIESNDHYAVEKIIQRSGGLIDANSVVEGMEMSLLHLAVGLSENSPEIVRILLRLGGNANNKNCSEKVSPLHLSVLYDYDEIMNELLLHGGDPRLQTGEGKSCFDIAKENLVNEMEEKCFSLLYRRYCVFRSSLTTTEWTYTQGIKDISEFTGYYSCDSSMEENSSIPQTAKSSTPIIENMKTPEIDSTLSYHKVRLNYSYLMTDDETAQELTDSSMDDKLTTIPEDTEPLSTKQGNTSSETCSNSTPPLLVSPTREQLLRLQAGMKKLRIPVTPTTYPILSKFEGAEAVVEEMLNSSATFSNELHQAIDDLNIVNEWGKLKIDFIQGTTPTHRTSKSFFNYVLLDPKITKRANFSGNHLKSSIIKNADKFETFLSAIFYVGKGCGKRPLQHLVEAKAKLQETRRNKVTTQEKVDKILEIWKSGLGVVVLSLFHHSSEREANVNEASMIDAIGLMELVNLKKGSYTGTVATTWSQKTKNQFGTFLLYKCFCTFAVSDPKYFYPDDV